MGESKQIFWSGFQVLATKLASFIFGIFIARIVAPEDYALIAMVSVFIAFFQLFIDSGLNNALIQKKDKSPIDYDTTFCSNLVLSILIYLIVFIIAPYIASFYHQPKLINIVRLLSLSLVLQGFYLVQKCRLTINIEFKMQATVSVYSILISGAIGLICALNGLGVWALVFQLLSSDIVMSILYTYFSKWMPKLRFSKASFNTLFRFGSRELIGNIFTSFFLNISNLLIGKFYQPSSLAFYNRGFGLSFLPAGMIQETLSRISYPIQCRYQSDRDLLLKSYYKYIGLSAYVNFTVMFLLTVTSRPLILVLLTSKWEGAIIYTQILSLAFLTYAINACTIQVVNAIGKPGVNVKFGILKRIITFIGLLVSIKISVLATAVSLVLCNWIELFISFGVSAKFLHISYKSQLIPLIKPLICSLTMALCCLGLSYLCDNIYILLCLQIFTAIFVMLSTTYLLRMKEWQMICTIMKTIKARLQNN